MLAFQKEEPTVTLGLGFLPSGEPTTAVREPRPVSRPTASGADEGGARRAGFLGVFGTSPELLKSSRPNPFN